MPCLPFFTALAAAALAGCVSTPTPGPDPSLERSTAAVAVATAPGAAAATATVEADASTSVDTWCERSAGAPFPAADVPTPDEQKALAGCDAEALYYGIGRPVDFVAARKCAYVQREDKKAPPIAGSAILLMVYANGKGAPVNLDLALRFACESAWAPAEREGRVERVLDGRQSGGHLAKELDFCDDITSGYMMGWCSRHEERLRSGPREARKLAAAKGLPAPAFDRIDKAAAAFFSERSTSEVDMRGTARGAMAIGEEVHLADDYVTLLEQLANRAFAPPEVDAAQAERELQEAYDHLMRCKKARPPDPGAVTAEGIKKTELLWLPYREAWLKLVAEARPGSKRDAWKAWLTGKRTKMLRELADPC